MQLFIEGDKETAENAVEILRSLGYRCELLPDFVPACQREYVGDLNGVFSLLMAESPL